MTSSRHCSRCVLLAALLISAAPAAAVTLGQIDDFQDGTTQGWGSGPPSPNPPVNLPDSGQLGAGDNSLMITSTGILAAGGRFTAFNRTQWAGDYLAAGVDEVVLDVNNIGTQTLNMRVALNGAGGAFVTTVSVPVLPGSGWQVIGLSIAPGDLTSTGGVDVTATLSGVSELRVISAANAVFQGDAIAAQGLVDNIVAVSEPGELLQVAAALATVGLLRVTARRRESSAPVGAARAAVEPA